MNQILLSMKRKADRQTLNNLLDEIYRTNRTFNISFVKQNGEPRIINGIARNYKQQKGTGTKAMTAKVRRANHNIFNCYEVQITKAEKRLAEQMHAEPKVKGFKSIQIENIERIVFGGVEYLISGNTYVLKADKVRKYLQTIQGNLTKEAELRRRADNS